MSWLFQPILPSAQQLASTSTYGYVKYWDGASWLPKPVKYWNGSSWAIYPLMAYDSSVWKTYDGVG
jgi:hypothetical protein